jgi:hypothetical protein
MLQQCHISRILEIFCGDAASPAGDAAPALGRCGLLPLEMYYLHERCTFPIRDAVSPECGCRVSRWRCGISTEDLQNSGYVTLLVHFEACSLSFFYPKIRFAVIFFVVSLIKIVVMSVL